MELDEVIARAKARREEFSQRQTKTQTSSTQGKESKLVTESKTSERTTARKVPPARTTKPPNTVSPGWIHRAIATHILKALKKNVEINFPGKEFYVGDLPTSETLAKEGGIVDDRQPLELLSRVLAHIGHRLPGLKKIERRLEGNARSSGLASDLSAFFINIYTKNEDVFNAAKENIRQQQEQKRAEQSAQANGGVNVSPSVPV